MKVHTQLIKYKPMRHLFLYIIILLMSVSTTTVHAQISIDTLGNTIFFARDVRFDSLIIKRAEINKRLSYAIQIPSRGFRVQVMSTSDRTKALDAKTKILTNYPQHKVYLLYQAPYFKIRVGNFINKKEANELSKELQSLFSAGVIIVNSDIELTKKEREDFINKLAEQEKEGKQEKEEKSPSPENN